MDQSNCAILVAIEPWKPFGIDSPIYSEGVKIQVLPASVKRSTPEAKHNGWIHVHTRNNLVVTQNVHFKVVIE